MISFNSVNLELLTKRINMHYLLNDWVYIHHFFKEEYIRSKSQN